MEKQKLSAQKRELTGRKVKTLRSQGFLPANIYGKKIKSLAISVKLSDFIEAFKKVGETGILNLEIEGEKNEGHPVLVANVQIDAVSDKPVHVDFHQIDLKEKVSAKVPVEVSGESPAEKTGIGTVVTYIDEIEVESLPADLPEKFVVDISKLTEVDQAIFVKDLGYDKAKVELKSDPEVIIAKVEPPQKEEAPAPAAEVAAAEGEVPLEGAVQEGEVSQPAEAPPETASMEEPQK